VTGATTTTTGEAAEAGAADDDDAVASVLVPQAPEVRVSSRGRVIKHNWFGSMFGRLDDDGGLSR
jgi:hypothetical protein